MNAQGQGRTAHEHKAGERALRGKKDGNRNIRCNAVAPGYIETEMTHVLSDEVKQSFMKSIPLGRMGKGEEVADTCVFLGSDMSVYVSGQTISVCGALNC